MFDLENYEFSHMPFVAKKDDKILQLCCLKINDKWKVHYNIDGTWKRLNTYTAEDATECCPTAEWNNAENDWSISFIAGGSTENNWENVAFKLYRKFGLNDSIPVEVCPANVGFVWKNQITFASKQNPIYIYEKSLKTTIKLRNVEFIYRLSYNPAEPRQLLISAKKFNGDLVSIAYIPYMDKAALLKDGNEVCYKCCMLKNGDVYYCRKRDNGDFEDRKIVKANNLTFQWKNAEEIIESIETEENEFVEDEE